MERDATGAAQGRPVPPALPGRAVLPPRPLARARRDARVPPLAHPRQGRLRDQGRARLQAPDGLRPARLRAPAPTGSSATPLGDGRGLDLRADRLAGRAPLRPLRRGPPGRRGGGDRLRHRVRVRPPARRPGCCGLGEHARVLGPDRARATRSPSASSCSHERHSGELAGARRAGRAARPRTRRPTTPAARERETAIRPERFARLVTLAVDPDRGRPRGPSGCASREVCERAADLRRRSCARTSTSSTSSTSAAASYVLYAEVHDDGTIEVDPEPYSDNFARPARLLPVEAKALVAAIDLIGDHLPEGALTSAREKIVAALGDDPIERGPAGRHAARGDDSDDRARRLARDRRAAGCCEIEYYKANEDEFSERDDRALRADQRARGLVRRVLRPGEGRRAPLPPGPHQARPTVARRGASSRGPRSTRPPTSTAGRAPARSRPRASRASGSRPSARAGRARSAASPRSSPTARSIVELTFKGTDWLVREVLKEAGDAVVLEPAGRRARPVPAPARRAPPARAGAVSLPRAGEPPRPDQDDRRRGARVPRRAADASSCATIGRDGWPHLMPLWYVVRDGRRCWGWTYAKSQKVRNLERDPRATLQVEAGAQYHELRGVMLECEVERPPRHRDGRRARPGDLRPLRRRGRRRAGRRGRARWSASRPPSASACEFVRAPTRDLGPPQARGTASLLE